MPVTSQASPVLPSWNDGPTKRTITDFVAAAVDESGPDFIPVEDRIATFDNDGTLWCERPVPTQLFIILQELAQQAATDPSLLDKQPWKAVAANDLDWFANSIAKHDRGDNPDVKSLLAAILDLSEGRPVEDAEAEGREIVYTTMHPTLGVPFKDTVFQPMVELLQYLAANGFTNYIVSGGGRDFMRGFTEQLYGVPRERVLGTRVAYRYEEEHGRGSIVQTQTLDLINDGPGKATEIWNVIGRRPALVGGNANGDLHMMGLARDDAMRLLVHHDDPDRDPAYTEGAEEAQRVVHERGWTLVSVKNDWARVYPDPDRRPGRSDMVRSRI